MSDLKTIEDAFLLKLNNNEISMEYNKTIAEILKERDNVVDFVNIKKGHSFNTILVELFYLEKIELKNLENENEKEISFFIHNNSHSTKITKTMLTTSQKSLQELFDNIKETQKFTTSISNKLSIKMVDKDIHSIFFYERQNENEISNDLSYNGSKNDYYNLKILSKKEINVGDILKINDLKMKYVGSNEILKNAYFEINNVIQRFEGDPEFIQLVLDKGQVILNPEKRKLKY